MTSLASASTGAAWWNVSLTSPWLLAGSAVLALAFTVTAGVTWDVARYRRTRRAGMLVAAQAMTALTLALATNMAGGFYGSLAELAGGRADDGGPAEPGYAWVAPTAGGPATPASGVALPGTPLPGTALPTVAPGQPAAARQGTHTTPCRTAAPVRTGPTSKTRPAASHRGCPH